jgi:hypothetical protein
LFATFKILEANTRDISSEGGELTKLVVGVAMKGTNKRRITIFFSFLTKFTGSKHCVKLTPNIITTCNTSAKGIEECLDNSKQIF